MNTTARTLGLALLLLAGTGIATARAADALAELEAGFRQPPAAARPWVYWFWMDGNISREGITADLEAMQRVGVGGMILMEVDVGVPRGPVHFMSDPWRALFKHAVLEAERLGLEITLNAGPGWTGSGGPWVRPEQSMQHLVASATKVTGPAALDQTLPRPTPRAPHSVHAPVPASLVAAHQTFYRDVAVLAYPTPTAKGSIPDADEKALYYRNPFSSAPGVKAYLPTRAEYPSLPAGSVVDPRRVVELTDRLDAEGRLRWDVPAGDWTILRLGRTSTGANTRPAPEPGIGFESDKFDPAALDAHFEAFVGRLLDEIGPRAETRRSGWTMLHIDSWEMGSQNWSVRFRDEFKARRGYDPLPYLPAMLGQAVQDREISERFLWDVRQTAQELVIQHHAGRLKELGRRHGFGLSIEPYDMNPCADLSLGGVADVPMCEFWSEGYGFNTVFSALEAVSIAHTLGRPVVAAEAFTADDREAWKLHPGNLKAQADWALTFGINRLVVHRFAHQPWLDRSPGMTMGPYGVHYERTQTWWELSGAWHAYLQRCQYLLRQGLPVVDALYLNAEGAPQVFTPPPSSLAGPVLTADRRGYSFDVCAPETLLTRVGVTNGQLSLPDGMRYRLLVLPQSPTMTPAVLERVRDLVRLGATVMGTPPRKSPSLVGYPQCDVEVQRLAAELWGTRAQGDDTPVRSVGKGRVIVPSIPPPPKSENEPAPLYGDFSEVAHVLTETGVPPDFESTPNLRSLHRRVGEVDCYFVSNRESVPVQARAVFRTDGRSPEFWDPVTADVRPLARYEFKNGRTEVELALPAQGSGFVVFGRRAAPVTRMTAIAFGDEAGAGTEVNGSWEVSFPTQPGVAVTKTFPSLVSWATDSEEAVKFFSGVAVYRRDLELPEGACSLDLGRVAVMARVTLNGRELGTVWTPPYRVDLTPAARPGRNQLEIAVANLWPNRLIGDQSRPVAERFTWATWNPYKKDGVLLESGLLGPVRVLKKAR